MQVLKSVGALFTKNADRKWRIRFREYVRRVKVWGRKNSKIGLKPVIKRGQGLVSPHEPVIRVIRTYAILSFTPGVTGGRGVC